MRNKFVFLTIIQLLAFLAFVSSCYEDKGNYEYAEIEEAEIDIPEITQSEATISYSRFETVRLDPVITNNGKESADEYDYEWSVYPQSPSYDSSLGGYPPAKVIGNDFQLNYTLEEVPGDYYVVLKATNKTTRSVSSFRFPLVIGTVNGWLVLEEDADGKGDISAIRDPEIVPGLTESRTGIIKNIFSQNNDGAKFTGAKFVYWRHVNTTYTNVFVYTSDDSYRLNAGTYLLSSANYQAFFNASLAPSVYQPQAIFYESPYSGQNEILINNGNVYSIRWNMMGQRDVFSAPVALSGVTLTVQPFIAGIPRATTPTNSTAVLYDDVDFPEGSFVVGDRFVTQQTSWNRPSVTSGAFDPTNINPTADTELKLLYLGTGRDGTTSAIFRDAKAGNKPWLYHGDFRDFAAPVAIGKYDISRLPEISAATHFVFGVRGDVLFYASGSNVYSHAFPEGATNNLLTVGSDETIAQLKLYSHSVNPDNTGRILFVATNSSSGGKVYKVKFNELTGTIVGTPVTFTGFNKIIDMTIKQ
ncbi:hypothetical protein EZS27_014049 [termite gut metagenome]|uniref:PKD domain-containing protein n=1 Tax=termite gut metagenome TaxID=433724 RepID=A0A5J4RWD4_9ZZZZ